LNIVYLSIAQPFCLLKRFTSCVSSDLRNCKFTKTNICSGLHFS